MPDVTWHIEPTSKCTLACPLCDRTWFFEKFKKRENHDIDTTALLNFFAGESQKITMCGNNGDPIYHPDFIRLCGGLKEQGSNLYIVTNGSHKKSNWWHELGSLLDNNDKVTFSIDGLEDTNKIYRKNSDWQSIMEAAKVLKSYDCVLEWKYIVFKHNQHQIELARSMSADMGFNYFRLEKSDRWWQTEMMPDEEYVDQSYHTQKKTLVDEHAVNTILPKCLKNNIKINLYIDSNGNFYPCCWQGLYAFRHKDIFDPREDRFNIKQHTAKTILEQEDIKNFFSKVYDYEKTNKCCKIYCGIRK